MTTRLPTHLFDARRLLTDPAELITYEIDAGFDRARPDGVFFPDNAADVGRLVQWAADHSMPLVARGAGTGLAGGAVAEQGGIVVVPARMNRIQELDRVGRVAVVEPGVVNLTLDETVTAHGLYYPPDPSSGRSSCIGGNLGTNAGGPHCFKYGVTTNYVLGLEVVLADGSLLQVGGQSYDYPEYDLAALMVGSEGTLGFITRAYLRLIRNPAGVRTMMVSFDSEEHAGQAVSAVIAAGLVPATLELMDQRSMRMIEEFAAAGLPVDAGAALIVEMDGFVQGLDSQMEEVADLLSAHGGFDIRIAQSEAERRQIWYGRKSAAGAFSRLAPSYYLTDVTVRRSLLGDLLGRINRICADYDVQTANFFHAGDGNLHPLILCDPSDPELMRRVHAAGKEIIELCIQADGSITGEHGVGMEKRGYMALMYSGAELAAMQEIKAIFDPQSILNPGKVLPDATPAVEQAAPVIVDDDFLAPVDGQAAAAILAGLTRDRRTARLGSATQGDRQGADVWLSTVKLQGIHTLAPADLYVTVGAGTPLEEVQSLLAAESMQVPMVSPWPQASVGGILSANRNGPLRMRYGSLRDVMLCATVAMADGRLIRAGRPLVKNVAGYDLPKLFVGAYGTLGLLTDVTLKLIPLPRSRRTLAAPAADLAQAVALVHAALPHALTASAILIRTGEVAPGLAAAPLTVLYTAEGMEDDVAAELDEVGAALRRAGAQLVVETDIDGSTAWAGFVAGAGPDELLVRAGVPVKTLDQFAAHLMSPARDLCIDGATGLCYLRHPTTDPAAADAWLAALRERAQALGGYALAMQGHSRLRDPWGVRPATLVQMQKLKARWDPAGILNPGAFAVTAPAAAPPAATPSAAH